jgi:SPOR domain
MTDTDRELGLQDEDRLPWLEAVENDEEEEGLSGSKLLGFLLAALLALGLVIGGIWWLRSQKEGPNGDSTLIAAQEGDYKVKPDEVGGMKVEGQGDSAFKTSEGVEANGTIDQRALPETPVAGQKGGVAPTKAMAPAKPTVTAVIPASGGKLAPALPTRPVAAPVVGGGALIQLGAYGSQASADAAWSNLTAKYPQLARLNKSVLPAAIGGNTLYRLRANAGTPSNATAICGQVGNCMVVK